MHTNKKVVYFAGYVIELSSCLAFKSIIINLNQQKLLQNTLAHTYTVRTLVVNFLYPLPSKNHKLKPKPPPLLGSRLLK